MEKLNNNPKNYYETGSVSAQICSKCGEPLFPPEAMHECGKLEKILKESRDKEGKTLYPQIEDTLRKAKEIWKNANGNESLKLEINFNLDEITRRVYEKINQEWPEITLLDKSNQSNRPTREGWDWDK